MAYSACAHCNLHCVVVVVVVVVAVVMAAVVIVCGMCGDAGCMGM